LQKPLIFISHASKVADARIKSAHDCVDKRMAVLGLDPTINPAIAFHDGHTEGRL